MDFVFDDEDRIVTSKQRKRGLSSPTIVENPSKKVTRRRVATNSMEVDFERPVERRRRQAPGKVDYLKSKKAALKIPRPSLSLNSIGWMVFALLCARLVFMDRGVIDFYAKEDLIKEKQAELLRVEQENIHIVGEIEKIKSVPSYQKKLAREHLGVIAKDEYLILFSKEGKTPSI